MKIKIKFVIIIIIFVIIISTTICTIFVINKNNNIDITNANLLLDENNLIPVKFDNLYGYIYPQNGEIEIQPKFLNANSFIGGYASVTFQDNDSIKYALIDKNGNIKLSANSATSIEIFSEYELVIADSVLYNKDLKQLTDKNTKVKYQNLGFCTYIHYNDEGIKTEVGVINSKGKKIYSYVCNSPQDFLICSIGDLNVSRDDCYGVLNINDEQYSIINLQTGKIIYDFSKKQIIEINSNVFQIYSEYNKKIESTISISKNRINYESNDDVKNKSYIENLTGYNIFSNNNKFGVNKYNKKILQAEYDEIKFLPEIPFWYLKNNKRIEAVVAKKNREYFIINLKNGKIIESFKADELSTYNTSTFIKLANKYNEEYIIYNLSTEKYMNINKDCTVSIFSNYFTVYKDGDTKYYNTNFEEIYID